VTDTPADKKPNIIHTRVPDDLDAEIKRRANNLGMSVSNLVRNVLQHTFGLVGDIVADSASVARSARGENGPTAAPAAPVVAWQEAILAVNAICGRCNGILPKGTSAGVALPSGAAFLCRPCLEEVKHA
jgi:hypothetical protein